MSNGSHPNDSLERLVRLKRFEEPPPGHLDRLSSRVIAQIEAEQALEQQGFWSRLKSEWDFRPLLACAYSAGAMALLAVGLALQNGASAPQMIRHIPADGLRSAGMTIVERNDFEGGPVKAAVAAFRLPSSPGLWRYHDASSGNAPSSTQPVAYTPVNHHYPLPLNAQLIKDVPGPILRGSLRSLQASPVNYAP